MGLSSSAAQLQANPASMPPALLPITGVIPFTETIFLWQSIALAVGADRGVGGRSRGTAPSTVQARRLRATCGVVADAALSQHWRSATAGRMARAQPAAQRAGRGAGRGWLVQEFASKGAIVAISNLNTYNLLFLMLGLLLHWRPQRVPRRGREKRCRRRPAC